MRSSYSTAPALHRSAFASSAKLQTQSARNDRRQQDQIRWQSTRRKCLKYAHPHSNRFFVNHLEQCLKDRPTIVQNLGPPWKRLCLSASPLIPGVTISSSTSYRYTIMVVYSPLNYRQNKVTNTERSIFKPRLTQQTASRRTIVRLNTVLHYITSSRPTHSTCVPCY